MNRSTIRRKRIRRKKIRFFIFILLIITNSYLLAKYTSTINGNHNVDIAKWEVSYDTNDNASDTLNLVSGNVTQDYIIKVISTSEVSAKYSIELSNLPNDIRASLDNGNDKTPINNKIVFNNVGTINASAQDNIKEHVITFSSVLGNSNLIDSNIYIDVIFDQKD